MKRLVLLLAIVAFLSPLFGQEEEAKTEEQAVEEVTQPVEEAVEEVAQPVEEAVEEVTQPIEEDVAPAEEATEEQTEKVERVERVDRDQKPAEADPEPVVVEEEPVVVKEAPMQTEQSEPVERDEAPAVKEEPRRETPSETYRKEKRKPRYSKREVIPIFGGNRGHGGYGSIAMGYSDIGGRDALMVGGRGAWILGHGLGLGIGGYGFVNDPDYNTTEARYYNLSGGYGGFLIEPIILGRWPIHFAFPVLLGAGGIALTSYDEYFFSTLEPYDAYFEEAVPFLVAEPGVELDLNLLRWLRLSAYANYRFTTEMVTSRQIDVSSLEGWSYGLTLKIGSF